MTGPQRWTNKTALLITAAVLFTAAAVAGLARILELVTPSAPAATHLRTAVTLVGVLGLAATAALAYRRQWLGEQQHGLAMTQDAAQAERDRRDHQQAIDRDLRERFTVAASQLGSDSLPVRLAGIYAMTALADSWLEPRPGAQGDSHRDLAQAQVCIDVLCGYLRAGDPATPTWQADGEVRESIIRTLVTKLRPQPNTGSQEQSCGGWSWADIDLRGAHFDHPVNFNLAVLNGNFSAASANFQQNAHFDQTLFNGGCDFDAASFHGRTTSFTNAYFQGRCTFAGAVIDSSTYFSSSRFVTTAGFNAAVFKGKTAFVGCRFESLDMSFHEAHFASLAIFSQSQFMNCRVDFIKTTFEGHADFRQCEFLGGERPVFQDTNFLSSVTFADAISADSRDSGALRTAVDIRSWIAASDEIF
ncbi:hypothetical protein GCM10027425_33650 [Alteromonas gracilis]